jgi:hypothetical protein
MTNTQSIGLLWTRDRLVAGIYTWQITTLTRDAHPCIHAVFEPAIPKSERQQTHNLDRAATGIGNIQSIARNVDKVKSYLAFYCTVGFNTRPTENWWPWKTFMSNVYKNRISLCQAWQNEWRNTPELFLFFL